MQAILFLVFAVFISSLVNSIFGFGFALVVLPLLSMYFKFSLLGPLIPLLFWTGSFFIILRNWKKIDFGSILPLAIAATVIVPIGVYLNRYGNENLIKGALGLFIVAFSIYNLAAPKMPSLKDGKWAPFFGGLSGFFGGLCNISGPPVVIYGTLRQWSPPIFRVSLQCYFVYLNLMIVANHVYHGSYSDPLVFQYYLYSCPAMLAAVPLGKKINSSIKDPEQFNKYVYILMIVAGAMLIFKSI